MQVIIAFTYKSPYDDYVNVSSLQYIWCYTKSLLQLSSRKFLCKGDVLFKFENGLRYIHATWISIKY